MVMLHMCHVYTKLIERDVHMNPFESAIDNKKHDRFTYSKPRLRDYIIYAKVQSEYWKMQVLMLISQNQAPTYTCWGVFLTETLNIQFLSIWLYMKNGLQHPLPECFVSQICLNIF